MEQSIDRTACWIIDSFKLRSLDSDRLKFSFSWILGRLGTRYQLYMSHQSYSCVNTWGSLHRARRCGWRGGGEYRQIQGRDRSKEQQDVLFRTHHPRSYNIHSKVPFLARLKKCNRVEVKNNAVLNAVARSEKSCHIMRAVVATVSQGMMWDNSWSKAAPVARNLSKSHIYKSNSVNSDPVDEPSTTKMYEHVLSFVPRFQTVKLSEIMNLSLQFASSDIHPSLQIAAGNWCFRE